MPSYMVFKNVHGIAAALDVITGKSKHLLVTSVASKNIAGAYKKITSGILPIKVKEVLSESELIVEFISTNDDHYLLINEHIVGTGLGLYKPKRGKSGWKVPSKEDFKMFPYLQVRRDELRARGISPRWPSDYEDLIKIGG